MTYIDPILERRFNEAGWTEQLDVLEEELDKPIRVLYAGGIRGYSNRSPAWTDAHIAEWDDRAAEHGITVAVWASLATAAGIGTLQISSPLTAADTAITAYDSYVPNHNTRLPEDVEELRFGHEHVLAELAPRLVVYRSPLHTLNLTPIDFDTFMAEPIRQAADPEFVERVEERRRARELEEFATWASSALDRQLDGVRNNIVSWEHALVEHQSECADAHRRLRDLKAQADALAESMQHTADDYRTMFERLAAHPRITDVSFMEQQLKLTTDTVTMTHPDHGQRTLGRMRISIGIGDLRSIQIENLDYPRNGRAHPHVPGNPGTPCFGDYAPVIAKYLGDLALVGLVEMLFSYLESFEPSDDYGRYAALWYSQPDPVLDAEPETQDAEAEQPTTA